MTIYLICNKSNGKRSLDKEDNLTPAFEYAQQALCYLDKKMGNSPYHRIRRID
jgi:hypothetical protein